MLIIAARAADLWGVIVLVALVWEVRGVAVQAAVVGEAAAAQVVEEVEVGLGNSEEDDSMQVKITTDS